MKRLAFAFIAACVLLLAACSQPLPPTKLSYAGEWQASHVYLLITPDGRVEYKRQRDGGNVSIEAPIKAFEGDNFLVGVGPFTTTFVVSQPPRQGEDGKWKMTVDGVELTRTSAFGEVQALREDRGSASPPLFKNG
jgi:hypothetical protein